MATVIALGLREIPALVVLALLAIAALYLMIFSERVTKLPPYGDAGPDDDTDAGVREPRRPSPSAGTTTAVADDSTGGLTP